MRVVNLTEFANLPAGTVFSHFEPAIVRGLFVKGETCQADGAWVQDFFETDVIPQQLLDDERLTDEIGTCSRWGEMDVDAQFMVYDDNDVAKMVELLTGKLKPTA